MTEAEWLTATDPKPMLEFLIGNLNGRKIRLFACACCRAIWPLLTFEVCRRAIEVTERFSDGLASLDEQWSAHDDAQCLTTLGDRRDDAIYATIYTASPELFGWPKGVISGLHAHWVVKHIIRAKCLHSARDVLTVCDCLRDIFGNPFRPVTLNPSWINSTVLALANGIYNDKAFDRMPILADALQDAGCDNEDILNHCRQPSEHVKGCWVVDLLLGK